MVHAHDFGWLVMIILFFVSFGLSNGGKEKGAKITSMILRVFYLVAIGTGATMLVQYNFPTFYAIKGLIAIILIGMMEIILAKTRRSEKAGAFWLFFVILLVVVILMGLGIIKF